MLLVGTIPYLRAGFEDYWVEEKIQKMEMVDSLLYEKGQNTRNRSPHYHLQQERVETGVCEGCPTH